MHDSAVQPQKYWSHFVSLDWLVKCICPHEVFPPTINAVFWMVWLHLNMSSHSEQMSCLVPASLTVPRWTTRTTVFALQEISKPASGTTRKNCIFLNNERYRDSAQFVIVSAIVSLPRLVSQVLKSFRFYKNTKRKPRWDLCNFQMLKIKIENLGNTTNMWQHLQRFYRETENAAVLAQQRIANDRGETEEFWKSPSIIYKNQ